MDFCQWAIRYNERERAPRQAAAARVRAGRVHQHEVGADASLSVLREYDQQRRTRCGAWCEERAGAAAGAGASRRARGVLRPNRKPNGEQGR
jgi:hypothetical protein